MSYYLKRGDTWTPTVEVTEDGEAVDCTGYNIKCWIKETLKETAAEIHELDINWTDQSSGEGYFSLTHEQSSNLLGRYWIQIVMYYETDNSIVRTLLQDKLIIRESLEINI